MKKIEEKNAPTGSNTDSLREITPQEIGAVSGGNAIDPNAWNRDRINVDRKEMVRLLVELRDRTNRRPRRPR